MASGLQWNVLFIFAYDFDICFVKSHNHENTVKLSRLSQPNIQNVNVENLEGNNVHGNLGYLFSFYFRKCSLILKT